VKDKDIGSLEHTSWRCQYHIVFAPKYRRQTIYREIKVDIGKILRQLCQQKGVEIIEAELCPDHIHMLVSIPPNLSVAAFVGYLKGKSALMIFDRGNQTFEWDEIDMLRFEEGDCACFTLEAHGSTAAERMIRRTLSAPV
jgi:REP element-mobilizing transposase RayT